MMDNVLTAVVALGGFKADVRAGGRALTGEAGLCCLSVHT